MRWCIATAISCAAGLMLSCCGIGFAYDERLVGDIGLVAGDSRDQMTVSEFHEGGATVLVDWTVFAVGWDESHVIAKRHPEVDHRNDRSRTEYFIVVVRESKSHGPFDEREFAVRRNDLGVAPGLTFTRVFRELE
jgi:hypothetical protein